MHHHPLLPHHRRALILFLLLGVLALLAPAAPLRAAGMIYVVPGGAGAQTGADWANARELQAALQSAASGDQIWVKAGTYKPTAGSDRSATFQLKSGVALYGGFAGTEASLDQRNPGTHISILSGDLLGNDANTVDIFNSTRLDNSYHVVTISGADNTMLLEDITITAGNASNGGAPDDRGGGILNLGGNATLRRIIFSSNGAGFGGGMYNANSDPLVTDSSFIDNIGGYGGGIFNANSSSTIANSSFQGNTADRGGGIYNDTSNAIIRNVNFSHNTAYHYGGGVHNESSHPTISHTIFYGNSSEYGGGINNTNSDPILSYVAFVGNKASWVGGGIANATSNPIIDHAIFSGNTARADDGGGAMFNNASNPMISQSTFSNNMSRIDNAATFGGGINNTNSQPTLRNSILWGNGRPIINYASGSAHVQSSLVQGGYSGGLNVIDGDPLFVDADGTDNIVGTPDDDLRLQSGSLAINRGDNTLVPADLIDDDGDGNRVEPAPFDLAGNPRFVNSIVDMGAYESPYALATCPITSRLYVDANHHGAAAGASWADAYPSLQPALNWTTACPNIVEIWVAHGTYKPSDGIDRSATFLMSNGVAIYGGFAGTETSLNQRNTANVTILSGDLLHNDNDQITITNPTRNDNSCHVMTTRDTNAATILDGFMIADGQAFGCFEYQGGGMLIINSSLTISNTNFSNNTALEGGGIFNINGGPTINQVIFNKNAANEGGGFLNQAGSPTISYTTFSDNKALQGQGGGLKDVFGNPHIDHVAFSRNSANSSGGGMHTNNSNVVMSAATFTDNRCVNGNGGGLYSIGGSLKLSHALFSGNLALGGGGMHLQNNTPIISYAQLLGNTATAGGGGVSTVGSSPSFNHAIFSGNTADYGGGMYSYGAPPGGGTVALRQASFTRNSATSHGSAIAMYDGSLTVRNSIIWDNRSEQLFHTTAITVEYSLVQGPSVYTGSGNLNTDPLFVDADGADNIAGTTDDNLRLQTGSPAINVGNNAFIPADLTDENHNNDTSEPAPFDLDGNPRLVGATVDLGAYEWQEPVIQPKRTYLGLVIH